MPSVAHLGALAWPWELMTNPGALAIILVLSLLNLHWRWSMHPSISIIVSIITRLSLDDTNCMLPLVLEDTSTLDSAPLNY